MAWDKTKNTPEQLREYYREYYKRKRKAKLDKQRAENPTYKICPMCGTKFQAKSNKKYCSEACKTLANKIQQKIYKNSGKGREAQAKYQQTEKYKETQAKYHQTEKYKESRKKYWSSERGKEVAKNYLQSEKGKACMKRYYEKRKANGGKPLSDSGED